MAPLCSFSGYVCRCCSSCMDFGASAGCGEASASVVLAAVAAAISGARSAAAAWFPGTTPNSAWHAIRLGSWTSVSLRVTPVHGGVTRFSRRREYEVVIFKERKRSGNPVKAKKRTLRTNPNQATPTVF